MPGDGSPVVRRCVGGAAGSAVAAHRGRRARAATGRAAAAAGRRANRRRGRDPARRPSAPRRSWSGSGGRHSPPTSSCGRCGPGRGARALDGLPASARSAANERRLDLEIAIYGPAGAVRRRARRLDTCLLVRAQLDLVRATDDPFGPSRRPRSCWCSSPPPSAARDAPRSPWATSTPPTTSRSWCPASAPTSARRCRRSPATRCGSRAAARRLAPARTTATVAWVGYDAPGPAEAVVDRAAVSGADLLAADVLAVQSARVVLRT